MRRTRSWQPGEATPGPRGSALQGSLLSEHNRDEWRGTSGGSDASAEQCCVGVPHRCVPGPWHRPGPARIVMSGSSEIISFRLRQALDLAVF